MISFDDFLKVDIRYGKILSAEIFEKARKPAYILEIDFGKEIGVKKSSAQITVNYTTNELIGKGILAVVNFPPKQIANLMSEVLVLGLSDVSENIALLSSDAEVELGQRVH